MSSQFCSTFIFTVEYLAQREMLHWIKDFVFHQQPKDTAPMVICLYHHSMEKLKEEVHCWKIDVEKIYNDDPSGI
jgi:hypothetical protein